MTNRKPVLVLGAGVIGLTTALVLRRAGWNVTIVGERLGSGITSNVAGALWEWPPGVCGKYTNLERARGWAASSLRQFSALAADPTTGVHVRPVTFYFRHSLAADAFQQEKMRQLAKVAPGFRHDAALIRENGIGTQQDYQDAYQHLAPMIDTDQYLAWLLNRVREAGCEVIARRVPAPLTESAARLRRDFGAGVIVNCSGFGALELVEDRTLYPLRGAVVRLKNDGAAHPRIEQAHCVSHDGISTDPGFIFIVPRGRDRLVLGGFAQPHESGLDVSLNDALVQEVLQRGRAFLPALRTAELDEAEPLRVGLRPAREQGARLAWDADGPILHNYGHGGSGITYSWGSAEDVARLLDSPEGVERWTN